MAKQYQALDERLARMEFELGRVSEAARKLLWADLQSCYGVHEWVQSNAKDLQFTAYGDFPSVAAIRKASDNRGEQAKACLNAAQNKTTSLGAANWFGNFVDARTAVTYSPETKPSEPSGEQFYTKSELERYITAIHDPSVVLVGGLLSRAKLPWTLSLDRLAAPVARIEDTQGRLSPLPDGRAACGEQGYLLDRMQPLVCSGTGGEEPDVKAFKLLSVPLVVEFSIDFADWMLSVSRLVNILDQSGGGRFIDAQELLAQAKNLDRSFDAGRDLVRRALMLLDLSIASYNMLYGDFPARAALDALTEAKASEPASLSRAGQARKLLKENSFLAVNTAMLLLRERYAAQQGGTIFDHPSSTGYRTALEVAGSVPMDPFLLLRGLFGQDLVFDFAPHGGHVRVELAEDVMVPMPGVNEFVQGRFSYPPRFIALLAQRKRLSERLADYGFYEEVDESMRSSLVSLIN